MSKVEVQHGNACGSVQAPDQPRKQAPEARNRFQMEFREILFGRDGQVATRFRFVRNHSDDELVGAVEKLLGQRGLSTIFRKPFGEIR